MASFRVKCYTFWYHRLHSSLCHWGICRHAAISSCHWSVYIDGLMQERRNSSALAMELRLSCINPSIFCEQMTHEIWMNFTIWLNLWTVTSYMMMVISSQNLHFNLPYNWISWLFESNVLLCIKDHWTTFVQHIDGLVQNWGNSIGPALELSQSCIEPWCIG